MAVRSKIVYNMKDKIESRYIMTLFNGRPESVDGRLEKEIRTYDYLDKHQIKYERVDHEPAETMEACKAVDEALGVEMCKNLMLCNKQKTAFYLLLMPGDKKFKTKELSSQINSARLSFAGAEYMEKYLDITPGSLSVMGLINDKEKQVKLLIDEDVLKAEYIGCHPCINTSSLKLLTADVVEKFIPSTGHDFTTVHLVGED
jgi:Ala-tRNA(Pro) deacylase